MKVAVIESSAVSADPEANGFAGFEGGGRRVLGRQEGRDNLVGGARTCSIGRSMRSFGAGGGARLLGSACGHTGDVGVDVGEAVGPVAAEIAVRRRR